MLVIKKTMKKTPTIAIRVPLKGYKVQTMSEKKKKVSGKEVTTKFTMPVTMKKGNPNKVATSQSQKHINALGKAMAKATKRA